MLARITAGSAVAFILLLLSSGCAAPPSSDDPDAILRADMTARWQTVERRNWTIDDRAIDGVESQSAWHITGTQWWVRLVGDIWSLDDLDPAQTYDVDGTAVDQNDGVISIHSYRVAPVTTQPAAPSSTPQA